MRLEKLRHIQILKILINAEKEVTADQLARATRSSLRTIKYDIGILNGLCVDEGCRIDSYKAKGYRLNVTDRERYEKMCADVNVLNVLYDGRSVESINRRMYILQRLLVDEYVKIEDLCDELFLSVSSIRKDMEWVRKFLDSYHLDLDSVSGKGFHVSGLEQDLRSAMVELRCSQYHEFQPLYPYEPFDSLFCKEGVNFYPQLRKAFLNILRASRITVSDIATKKITSHICLLYRRQREGKTPLISKEMIEELRKTYDYQIARQVFADETVREYVEVDDIEVVNLARLLLINRDLNLRIGGVEDLPVKLVLENQKIFKEVISEIDGTLGARMHRLDLFRIYDRDLESLQMQLYLIHHFDHTGKVRFITYQEGRESMISPIPLEMTRNIILQLQKKFNEPIFDAVILSYAAVYERLFKKITYPYRKLRIAVATGEGLVYSQHISESLQDLYGQYIQYVDVFDLYEMRSIDFNDYDVLLYPDNVLYYAYPLPIVNYRELDYDRTSGELFDKMFKSGFDSGIVEKVKEIMNIYGDEESYDINGFVKALSYRYGKDDSAQKEIYSRFIESEKIVSFYYARTGILIVPMDHRNTDRNIFDLYVFRQGVSYEENREVKALICVSIDTNVKLADLKVLDHILRYIVQVPGTVEHLGKNKEDVLDRIFDTIIRRKFLNQ